MLLLTLAACLAADPIPDEEKLLAKGDGYFVHAIRNGPISRGGFGTKPHEGWLGGSFLLSSHFTITHLNAKTGKLTRLVSGGRWSYASPPMGLNSSVDFVQSIYDVTTDADQLYVLLARTQWVTPGQQVTSSKVIGTIQVFRLTDGKLVQEIDLPKPFSEKGEGLAGDHLGWIPLSVSKDELVVGDLKQPHAKYRLVSSRKLELEPAAEKK